MNYLRRVNLAEIDADPGRQVHRLLDHDSGASSCSVNFIVTPPGEGSPAGLHTHRVDQLFYILQGTMNLEIEGREYVAEPGTLVVMPAGVPHRNWNGGDQATRHLAFNAPLPAKDEPFAQPVDEPR